MTIHITRRLWRNWETVKLNSSFLTFDLFKRLKMTGESADAQESESILYFAFGSNLSSHRIRICNKTAIYHAVGLLKGYRLEFCYRSARWKGSAANIFPDPCSNVYGVLWQLNRSDLKHLDKQEGVADGIYERTQLLIEVEGEPISCFAYQLTQFTRQNSVLEAGGEAQRPSKVYKDVIIRGAKEHHLPPHYIQFLENIQDNGFDGVVDLAVPDKAS